MTTQTLTVAEFLLARIAEDEGWLALRSADLELCQECGFGQQPDSPYSLSRLMAECAAKRKIVERDGWAATSACALTPTHDCSFYEEHNEAMDGYENLRILASVWSDHPDFNPEWA